MNVPMLLEMAESGFGDRVIVGSREEGLTVARLRALAVGGAAAIRSAGADSLLYLAASRRAFHVAFFAAAHAGVPFIPVNYRLGRRQFAEIVERHPGALALTETARCDVRPRDVAPLQLDEWLAAAEQPADAAASEVASDAVAALIYTSGSTAEPKAVVLRHRNLVSYVLGAVEFGSAGPDEAALMCVPAYHIAAVASLLTNVYTGRRTVIMDSFDAEGWLELVRREGITHAFVVPTMLARIVELAQAGRDVSAPSLRSLAYGGAPMPRTVVQQALALWPLVDFVNAYGLTETSSTISLLGPDEHRAAMSSRDPAMRRRLDSVGRPLPTVEIEIRDDDGRPLPAGGRGRIWARGDQIAGEYIGADAVVDANGWFDTRDEGVLDSDGFLFVRGRADDTIIRGAENIAPAEIEEVLLSHESVAEAVAVGLPDEEWGERIVAVVAPRAGHIIDPDEVRRLARDVLRGSKTPERIEVWDELPRTEMGKIIRRAVVERLLAPRP